MGRVIISHNIIQEPVMMMQVVLREVEAGAVEKNLDPAPIKQRILDAPTVANIVDILDEIFGGEIVVLDKYQKKVHG